jgi:hypothetical protein
MNFHYILMKFNPSSVFKPYMNVIYFFMFFQFYFRGGVGENLMQKCWITNIYFNPLWINILGVAQEAQGDLVTKNYKEQNVPRM